MQEAEHTLLLRLATVQKLSRAQEPFPQKSLSERARRAAHLSLLK